MKKVLLYNWTQYGDPIGGGVTVYIKNLVSMLVQSGKYAVTYLNSGWSYDKKRIPYIKKVDNPYEADIETYELINSPVLAPMYQCSPKNIQQALSDTALLPVLCEFIKSKGGYDIIHFNNLEGLSLNSLRLKEYFPNIRTIYSIHNYSAFCSQVNLWQTDSVGKQHNCCKQSFEECVNCYTKASYNLTKIRRATGCKYIGKIRKVIDLIYQDRGNGDLYKNYQNFSVQRINESIDTVLAVSRRVSEIALENGILNEKLYVSYIGTKVAEKAKYFGNTAYNSEVFRIVYMGYMKEEKGYYFFIDCLKAMPLHLAQRIEVTIIAKHDPKKNKKEVDELDEIKNNFKKITLINGYNPENQQELLRGKHLGIVPVLWEDNLPQVAIEQIAYGVPIMVSDLGGAQELCKDERFVFKAGNIEDFVTKLCNIIENPSVLEEYWKNVMKLRTLNEHFSEIQQFYAS